MLEVEFDLRQVNAIADGYGAAADQLAFVLSRSLNDAVFAARRVLVNNTWPSHVTQRNANFINAALVVDPSSKKSLTAQIRDRLGRAHLKKHAEGGIKTGRGMLAINTKNVKRTGRGVPAGQRPRALPNSFLKDGKIFQRMGGKAKRGKRIRVMYILTKSAVIKKDVPFHEVFQQIVRNELYASIPRNVAHAMSTRRSR